MDMGANDNRRPTILQDSSAVALGRFLVVSCTLQEVGAHGSIDCHCC